MRHLFSSSLLASGLAVASLGACSLFLGNAPHVPSDFAGTTQITVANASDRDLCVFAIFANDPNHMENWLGDKSRKQNIAPGGTRVFSIKPGVYHVLGGYCDGEQAIGASGTYGPQTTVIGGPTLIALGPKPVADIPGTKKLAFSKVWNVAQGGGGDQGGAEEPAAEEPAAAEESSSGKSEAVAPTQTVPNPGGKPSGAVCDQSYQCASNACVTHSPNNYCR